ncbi:hypothetical protein IOD06_13100 [Psychrobacter sp. N25K4-3-2]|uniref:hypothetical protein n=1 Tax=Psychrobacter sp. N25K4-3-2 TaxID=2785026 RepID=UPI00188BDD28|nr:hypothetical protein [Psychrobacter sp. N25K4-3-2]MBF4490827.1 hypothetical protein [Psychrobacter sp. N25K4-3-2]
MGDKASDNIDKKLDKSINKIDGKIDDLDGAVHRLKERVRLNNLFFMEAENKALKLLKEGVKELTQTDLKREYSAQIAQVITNIEPFIESKINDEIEKLIEHKKLSISNHNEQVKEINDKLESNMTTIHTALLESIDKLNTASADANTRYDEDLSKLKQVAVMHNSALQSVKNSTDVTAKDMKTTLTSIKRNSVFMSQSPATMTAMTAGFLSLCLIASIVYVYDLWSQMFISAAILCVLLGAVWVFIAWLDGKEN